MAIDLACIAPLILADIVLAGLIYRDRQRRRRAPDPRTPNPANDPMQRRELIINDPRARRAPAAGYRTNELAAGPAPTLDAPGAPRRPHPRSFTDRCGQAIAAVLADSGIAFRAYVPPGAERPAPVEGPRTLTFLMVLERPADLEKALGLDERLAMGAAVESARVARYRGVLGVEFELPPARWTDLALDRPGRGQHLRLGKNTLNRATHLDLGDATTAHALLAGTSGAGKTVLLQSILYQAALADPGQQRLLIVDGKRELQAFYYLPHLVAPPAIQPEDALRALAWTAAEIMRRGEPGADRTPLTVAIDELALLVAQDKGAVKPLAQILSLGRSRNVHVVAGTQRVSSDVLGNRMLSDNFTVRLVGQVMDASASVLATGQAGLGANRLSGKGDFLSVAGANVTRFTVARTSDAQLAGLPRVEVVADQIGGGAPEALAMVETIPAQTPACTTPAMYAALLATWVYGEGTWPGIGRVAADLRIGKARAERVRGEAQELVEALSSAGVGLVAKT